MGDPWDGIEPITGAAATATGAVAEVARLAGLAPTEYEAERKAVAARLGWRASVLDAEVQKGRPRGGCEGEAGGAAIIETLDPWPDPVDGASLADEIRDQLRAHVIFGASGDADAATLWIFGTFTMAAFRLWPRLLVTSPTKACGKSTLLEVIEATAHRGLILSNATPAAVFRAIEAWAPTLLLDEADTWMRENVELAGILNSGHTRRTARVIRVEEKGGELVPTLFSTWSPMVIAGIGAQRDTLESRSIKIGLRRKLPDESVQRLPFDLHERATRLRRQAARWAADNAVTLGALETEPPECGDDRRRDNFTPLHRIAAVLGGPWPDRIAAAYIAAAQAEDDDAEPAGVLMLRDIAEIFAARSVDRVATSDIVGELVLMEDRPWADWRHGRPISAQSVAKQMKPFGIKAKVLKLHGASARVYLRGEVEAAAARYTAQKCNPVTLQQNQEVIAFSKRNPEQKVTPEKPDNPLKTNDGYGVTPARAAPGGCDVEAHRSVTDAALEDWRREADDPRNPDVWS